MNLIHAHVVVIGGGYVGQLIQHAIPSARLLDWRKTAPADHLETRIGPQYLWEPIPGLKSYSFPVITLVDGKPPTPESILAYKKKIGKQDDEGDWGLQFQHETVGWHSHLPVPRVEYDRRVRSIDLAAHTLTMKDEDDAIIHYDLLLNTIPLDYFLRLCVITPPVHYPWRNNPIYMTSVNPVDATEGYTLNYISSPEFVTYRITFTPGKTFYETLLEPADRDFVKLVPGKIHPHPESEKILKALRMYGVQCFGRYATWRPDELAHQTWEHIVAWRDSL